jgi:hypothetical protein
VAAVAAPASAEAAGDVDAAEKTEFGEEGDCLVFLAEVATAALIGDSPRQVSTTAAEERGRRILEAAVD